MLKCPNDRKNRVVRAERRTRAEVQQLAAEFVSSGMRPSKFCQSRGLSFSTLDRHLKKLRWKRRRKPISSAGQLVPGCAGWSWRPGNRRSGTNPVRGPAVQPTGGTEGCGDSLGRGKLPSAESSAARLFFHDSPRSCRSPDRVPSKPYSRCVGRPAFYPSRASAVWVEVEADLLFEWKIQSRAVVALRARRL